MSSSMGAGSVGKVKARIVSPHYLSGNSGHEKSAPCGALFGRCRLFDDDFAAHDGVVAGE